MTSLQTWVLLGKVEVRNIVAKDRDAVVVAARKNATLGAESRKLAMAATLPPDGFSMWDTPSAEPA
jgi:hypothetical protein